MLSHLIDTVCFIQSVIVFSFIPSGHGSSYCTGFYPMSCKPERSEPIYEGSRSLYTRSPPLTRVNLNRSQSVYTKTVTGQNLLPREHIRPGGPLYPSYPVPTSNSTPINQNHQNQQRQSGENIYGSKPNRDIYGKIPGRNEYGYSGGVKKQDASDNTYNSYISNSSGSSKVPAADMTRKDNHQNVGIPSDMAYYHNQSSPNSQY